MISRIFGILYANWFIQLLRIFILSNQCPEMHIYGVIPLLSLTPTHGPIFVPMQWWKFLWRMHFMIIQICMRPLKKFRVWNSPSNLTPKMKFDLEKLKNLPDQVKSLSENLTKFKSNQNSTYDMVHEINCRGVWKWTLSAELMNHSTVFVDSFINGEIDIEFFSSI